MMEQTVKEKIIADIKTKGSLNDSVKAFQQLLKEDKIKILMSLKNIEDETVGNYLNALYVEETDKEIRKQIGKSIFSLKTKGINVEAPKATGESVLRKTEEVREHRALLSNYDIEHMRLIVASYELKKSSFVFFTAALNFSQGLFKLTSGPLNRAGLNNIMKKYPGETKGSMSMVNISPVYAAYLMEEAAIQSGKYKDETGKLSRFTSTMKEEIRKPADIYTLPIPETTRSLPLEKILQNRLFDHFSIEWTTLEEDKKTYNSFGGSTIILPPYMLEEKKNAFVKELIEIEEIKSKLPLIKRMIEDYSYIFHILREYSCYKGLVDYSRDVDVPRDALMYFIRKALEISEDKQPGLIKMPYG